MKKQLLLILLSVICLGANASKLPLSMESLTNGWGSAYDAATKTITYESGWTGRGWGLTAFDITPYKKVVVEFEAITTDLKMVLEYTGFSQDTDESKKLFSEAMGYAGSTKIELEINEEYAKLGAIQVYLQNFTSAAASVKLVDAYLTDEQEDLGEGVDIPFDEYGNVLLQNYEKYDDNDIVKLVLKVTSGEGVNTQPGWGIGKIIPISNYDVTSLEFACQAISETGELNEYQMTIGKLKEYAKVDGEYYEDQYGQKGVTINVWGGATRESLKVYPAAQQEDGEDVSMGEWGHVALSILEKYDDASKVKLILKVKTHNDRNVGWGVAKIIPIGNYSVDGKQLNCTALSDEGELNEFNFTIGELKELAKVDGVYYEDEYGQKGITVNTWDNVERVSFTVYPEVSTGISDTILKPAKKAIISFVGGIEVDNNGEKVTIYGIDGSKVMETTDNRIYLTRGMYLVQIGKSVNKVVVR